MISPPRGTTHRGVISGTGSKVGQSGFGSIKRFPYTPPYEDLTLEGEA